MQRTSRELNETGWRMVKGDVFSFLNNHRGVYDIVFADAPFHMEGIERVPALVLQSGLLGTEGLLIVEHQEKGGPFQTTRIPAHTFLWTDRIQFLRAGGIIFDHRAEGTIDVDFIRTNAMSRPIAVFPGTFDPIARGPREHRGTRLATVRAHCLIGMGVNNQDHVRRGPA